MHTAHRLLAATAAATLLLGSAATWAQDARCDGPGPRPTSMGRPHGGAPGLLSEQHLARLKADLKLSAAQEPAWNAFAAKAGEQARAAQAQREAQAKTTPPATTPERMAQHLAMLKQHQASLEVMSTAMKGLYDALTPEQRATLDRMGPAGERPEGPPRGERGERGDRGGRRG